MSRLDSFAALFRAELTPLYQFQWHPDSKAFIHVVCKASGKLASLPWKRGFISLSFIEFKLINVASVEVPLYMTVHFINAYEETDEHGRIKAVIVDCCEHINADTTILEMMNLQHLRSFNGEVVLPDARVGRFIVPLDGSPYGKLEAALDPDEHGKGMDMCSINPAYLGKKYRYAYACGAQRPCNFPNTLTKIDLF
ncbi:carotenoid cleavage dioxygenase 8 homolog B, chloroplastic-like [Coffea arabica]|uniref:Carotenoid cleavage dioxygenase 8 homolog B, chloroplastic-like n=1 Tax=Coffea arabica TaxID=13443 RepID=A0ABM4VBR8_COFAR